MADNDTANHDRTEQPTAKRLEDARQQGQVARSRELSMTAVTLAGAAVLALMLILDELEQALDLGAKVAVRLEDLGRMAHGHAGAIDEPVGFMQGFDRGGPLASADMPVLSRR